MNAFPALLAEIALIQDLRSAAALLDWDHQTYMPRNAAEDRASQLASLASVIHERETAPGYAKHLEAAEKEVADFPPDSLERCLVRVLKRNFEKESRVPASLVRELAETSANAHHAWAEARETSDFSLFAPFLERLLDLARRYAALFAPYRNICDPLLDNYEEGLTAQHLDPLFSGLQEKLVPLLRKIAASPQPDDSFLRENFDPAGQLRFSAEVLARMGYDFTRGRQDLSVHPFTASFGLNDVRITTRVQPDAPLSSLLSSVHEGGHALYELGIDKKLNRTPLANGASLGFHESQSRLWENLVARSLPFWECFFPRFREIFPGPLADADTAAVYRAINKVTPSLIRTEADEVTYNLHVMLRYEMEKELLNGTLSVKDAPDAWNRKSMEYLGIEPGKDSLGILQDIHWSMGSFGYFPTYALGTLLSAQIWQTAEKELGPLDADLRAGNFAPLLDFLRSRLHVHGAMFTPQETLRRVCGVTEIDPACFLGYLEKKYSALYGF
ncbi:MAG: Thermostable carboxypeptidase 1 [Lentisphaerae bacterium ADurb.Bin242]|nr:MAG: Thermostable carboxypeptidase 1 [Lentisphaerae bacterium ADurb.Bin242]